MSAKAPDQSAIQSTATAYPLVLLCVCAVLFLVSLPRSIIPLRKA